MQLHGLCVFRHRHEAALSREVAQDVRHGVHGRRVGIVEEKHAAHSRSPAHGFQSRHTCPPLPVMAVHGPEDNLYAQFFRRLSGSNIVPTKGRTHKARCCAQFLQELLDVADSFLLLLKRHVTQCCVGVSVIGHFMAFGQHLLHQLRPAFYLAAYYKEGCLNTMLPQNVQKALGMRAGTVIKCYCAQIFIFAQVKDSGPVQNLR